MSGKCASSFFIPSLQREAGLGENHRGHPRLLWRVSVDCEHQEAGRQVMKMTKDFLNWLVIIGYPNPESYQSHDLQEILHLLRGRPDLGQVRGDGGALCQVSMKLKYLWK